MPRIARVVAPGVPHHVTQRGNSRQRTSFVEGDHRTYLQLVAQLERGIGRRLQTQRRARKRKPK